MRPTSTPCMLTPEWMRLCESAASPSITSTSTPTTAIATSSMAAFRLLCRPRAEALRDCVAMGLGDLPGGARRDKRIPDSIVSRADRTGGRGCGRRLRRSTRRGRRGSGATPSARKLVEPGVAQRARIVAHLAGEGVVSGQALAAALERVAGGRAQARRDPAPPRAADRFDSGLGVRAGRVSVGPPRARGGVAAAASAREPPGRRARLPTVPRSGSPTPSSPRPTRPTSTCARPDRTCPRARSWRPTSRHRDAGAWGAAG